MPQGLNCKFIRLQFVFMIYQHLNLIMLNFNLFVVLFTIGYQCSFKENACFCN